MILFLEKAMVWTINFALVTLLTSSSPERQEAIYYPIESSIDLKTKTFKILDNKCNVCHKRRNPFMIFKPKNMERRAKRIYRQVVVTKRMPKGDEYSLTKEEYDTLVRWLDETLKTRKSKK